MIPTVLPSQNSARSRSHPETAYSIGKTVIAVSASLRHFPFASAPCVLSKSCQKNLGVTMQVISEGPVRITKATIDAAWRRRKPDHRVIVRDQDCRGLALVVNPTGMAWTYAYRPRGSDPLTGRRWPNRTATLGNPATHSPDDARTEANRLKGLVQTGADPVAAKKAAAAVERLRRGTTLGRLADNYMEALPRRSKMRGAGPPSSAYVAEELAQLQRALRAMEANDMPVTELGEPSLRGLLSATEAGVTVARKRFGALSRFLDWCQDAGHVSANPCALIARSRRPRAPQARSHYLPLADLGRLWDAAERLTEPVCRDLVRFLIAVPCRRNEAARLDWAHVDISRAEWRQPGQMTKNRDAHRLHLHGLAVEVLCARRKSTGGKGLVFPAPRSGQSIDTFTAMKDALNKATGLDGWTWHDFRRSFVTALAESGVSETVADAILNHRQSATRGGVLGVYQRASRWPEQVKAMEHWGRLLAAAMEGDDLSAVVVPMVARAG
jgi:integrase